MKLLYTFITVAALACIAVGCGEEPLQQGNPPPLAISEVATVLETQFADASDEVRKVALAAVEAVNKSDYPAATLILQKLCTFHELTGEQRRDATRSLRAAQDEMAKAADAGDKQAEKVNTYILENK